VNEPWRHRRTSGSGCMDTVASQPRTAVAVLGRRPLAPSQKIIIPAVTVSTWAAWSLNRRTASDHHIQLTRPQLILATATLVNTVGNGSYLTAGILYFTKVLHLPVYQVGWASAPLVSFR